MADFTSRMLIALARFIEREAGHVTVCLTLIAIGASLYKLNIPKGEDLIVFSLGVLGRSLVGHEKEKP